MKTRSGSLRRRCRKSESMWPGRVIDRLKAYPQQRQAEEIQLIYAHFAPRAIYFVTESRGYTPKPGKKFSHASSQGDTKRNTRFSQGQAGNPSTTGGLAPQNQLNFGHQKS